MNLNVAFTFFNRPQLTAAAFEPIRQAKPERLFLIADGPRHQVASDPDRCAETRGVVESLIDWNCDVYRNYSSQNLGCKMRQASGYSWVFENVEHCILLEDDCVADSSFFPFCQELLERYRDDQRIMAVSGDNFQGGKKRTTYSYYFSKIVHVWGWATWRRAWQQYDVDNKLWPEIREGGWLQDIWRDRRHAAMWTQNFDQIAAGLDSWDHQFTFAMYVNNALCILPNQNLVTNIGFGPDATHTHQLTPEGSCGRSKMSFPLIHPPFMINDSVADLATYNKYLGPATEPNPISDYYNSLNKIGVLNYRTMAETGESHFLKSTLPLISKPVVFDVGANEGEYSAEVLKYAANAEIYAFEPHPITFNKLTANLASTPVHLTNAGLGREEGTLQLFDYADNDGSSHASVYQEIIKSIHKGTPVCHEIQIVTLDGFVDSLGLPKIDLLKIDVEGHELAVLQGAERTIRAGRIAIIQFEFNETNVISRTFFKDFWDFLPEYNFYRLLPNGEIIMQEYTPAFCEIFAFQNIVCVRK